MLSKTETTAFFEALQAQTARSVAHPQIEGKSEEDIKSLFCKYWSDASTALAIVAKLAPFPFNSAANVAIAAGNALSKAICKSS